MHCTHIYQSNRHRPKKRLNKSGWAIKRKKISSLPGISEWYTDVLKNVKKKWRKAVGYRQYSGRMRFLFLFTSKSPPFSWHCSWQSQRTKGATYSGFRDATMSEKKKRYTNNTAELLFITHLLYNWPKEWRAASASLSLVVSVPLKWCCICVMCPYQEYNRYMVRVIRQASCYRANRHTWSRLFLTIVKSK